MGATHVRKRRHDLYRVRALAASLTRTPSADRSVPYLPENQHHSTRCRVRRSVLFQSYVSPVLWHDALRIARRRKVRRSQPLSVPPARRAHLVGPFKMTGMVEIEQLGLLLGDSLRNRNHPLRAAGMRCFGQTPTKGFNASFSTFRHSSSSGCP